MGIKAVCLQNEVTVNTNYVFQVSLCSDVDDTAWTPDTATVKFLRQDKTTILDTVSMTIGSGVVSYTLSSSYLNETLLYNAAVITLTKSGAVQVVTKLFHVVQQIITNPLRLEKIYDRYAMIDQHKKTTDFHGKIKDAFERVKDDLRKRYGLEYSSGMIDSSQIEELVLLKTVIYISRDYAAGQGMTEDNYWYMLLGDTRKEYAAEIEGLKLAFDSTLDEHVPDRLKFANEIRLYR